jgi:hypothetical protein
MDHSAARCNPWRLKSNVHGEPTGTFMRLGCPWICGLRPLPVWVELTGGRLFPILRPYIEARRCGVALTSGPSAARVGASENVDASR